MAKNVLINLDFQSTSKPVNLPSPVNSGDAATKGYADSLFQQFQWKLACRTARATNTTVSSPGSVLAGVTMNTGDRVLLYGQTNASENGIYVWNGATVPMTRALDADTFAKLIKIGRAHV